MTEFERQVAQAVQDDFPVRERPYLRIAESLAATEDEVLAALRALRDRGVLRDASPVLNPRALGYVTTLACLTVPPERVDEVAAILNAYDEVTHNYLRDHPVNVWFTLVAESRARVAEILREVEARTGLGPIRDLPSGRVLKLRAVFEVSG